MLRLQPLPRGTSTALVALQDYAAALRFLRHAQQSLSGQVSGRAAISGSINEPILDGRVDLRNGAFTDSFTGARLEYPQYTRPEVFRGLRVPDILLTGDHAAIARWRAEESRRRTAERRPDLLQNASGNSPETGSGKKA